VTEWFSMFAAYRTLVVRNDEVVQGLLRPDLDAEHPEVRAALESWRGMHFLNQTAEGVEVTLVRRLAPRPRERWWLHILLGLATVLTTTVAGAYFAGRQPLVVTDLVLGAFAIPLPIRVFPSELLPGLVFSVPLFGILLGHELGHYLVARRHGMDVSPPFFIPSPHFINLIGTFGAFIRIRSAMVNRLLLLDVGVGGPLASFVLSIPVLLLGLHWSRMLPQLAVEAPAPFVVVFAGQPIWLGGSILLDALVALVRSDAGTLMLHPLAFAGWLGLFVTALNLFPLAQLDGGHILYALIGRWQQLCGLLFLGLLFALGFVWWGWWLWAGLILFLGRGSIRHPAVLDPDFPVTGGRRVLGWVCVAIFFLTFVVVPIRV
jgi:hypothetical protein